MSEAPVISIVPLVPKQQVRPWQVWQHHSGTYYGVIALPKFGSKHSTDVFVLYFDLQSLLTYTVQLSDWHRKMPVFVGSMNLAQKEAMLTRLGRG